MRAQMHMVGVAVATAMTIGQGVPMSASAQTRQPAENAATNRVISENAVITVVGCIQSESAYRTSTADAKGGPLGTGAGVANEYVLIGGKTVTAETLKPVVGTAGRLEADYSLTGDHERELLKAVGRHVAVTGVVEVDKSKGTDWLKDLPRLNLSAWREVPGSCASPTAR